MAYKLRGVQDNWQFGGVLFNRQTFYCMHVLMAIPYHTTKFKSVNTVKHIIWGQTAKFNDCQYFRGYRVCVYVEYR